MLEAFSMGLQVLASDVEYIRLALNNIRLVF